MPPFTLHIRNLHGLRHVCWSPRGLSLLVGPNGAGKTTVLLVLKLLRAAVDRGLSEAVTQVLGGSHSLRHHDALEEEPVELGLDLGGLRWRVCLRPRGPSVDHVTEESLHAGERVIFTRDSLGNFALHLPAEGGREPRVEHLNSDERLGLRAVLDAQRGIVEVQEVVDFIRGVTVFHDPDLVGLRLGSHTAHTAHLHSRGRNALTLLRRWSTQREHRARYQLVLDGLGAAFPSLVSDLDFEEAGSTLVARVYRPGRDAPVPLSHEANGVLAMLIALCALAAAEPGGVVALDEAENALHPYAQRVLARLAAQRARQLELTVILSTHSTVLLDHFDGEPERVFVLDPRQSPGPTPVSALPERGWLREFRLGEGWSNDHFGSNGTAG